MGALLPTLNEVFQNYQTAIDKAIKRKDFDAAYRLTKARDSLIPEL